MDISFMTSAGDGAWSLEECARWAADHDFDCVRLADRGVLDSERILTEGPDEVKETLAAHDLYLACVTAHCNLLDDEEEVRMAEQARLIRAIESARALDCPVVITGSGAPVRNGQFYGMYWGRKNLRYKAHLNFRPVPTFERATRYESTIPEEER